MSRAYRPVFDLMDLPEVAKKAATQEAFEHGKTLQRLEYAQRALQAIFEATKPGKRAKPAYILHALAMTGLELSDEGFRLSAKNAAE